MSKPHEVHPGLNALEYYRALQIAEGRVCALEKALRAVLDFAKAYDYGGALDRYKRLLRDREEER